MDGIFLNELLIFLGICAIFGGTVPVLLRGHQTESIEAAVEAATSTASASMIAGAAVAGVSDGGATQVRSSRKRKARARDAAKNGKA